MSFYVTDSVHATNKIIQEGKAWAENIGAVFVNRQNRSVTQLLDDFQDMPMVVYTANGPEIITRQGRHAFQLSIAELRILQLRRHLHDHMIEAIQANEPISFLDCTCGFASDSIVASFALPNGSTFQALEVSPLLEAVTAWGLQHFVHEQEKVTKALRRIQLQCRDYQEFLTNAPEASFDVIYFDPMFSYPVHRSPQFEPVRAIMDHRVPDKQIFDLALTKARKRVVIKGRRFNKITEWYPQVKLYGGKYSRIGYAVLECNRE